LKLALSLLDPAHFSGTWYAGRVLYLLTSAFVLAAAVRTLSGMRGQVLSMTASIAESRRILERNAARLNGLWYVASHGVGDDRQRYQALLDTATAALRPGSSTFGYISHIAGERIVIDSVYGSALLPHETIATSAVYYPGAEMPLDTTIEQHLNALDRSAAWTDFSLVPAAGMAWEPLGWTRVIGSALTVGAKQYFMVFGSKNEYVHDPYSEDDFTYVDVLAAFVAGRLLQEAQIERIKFQIEHDALTGLHTRAQFRVAIRKAIKLGNPFAVAALDIDDFRAINEEAGSMIADELLVEVASGIDGVSDDDVAARLGADEFGLLLAHRQTGQLAQTRLAEYFGLFETPFPTGLSADTRKLAITASIGAASFPEDGHTEQELMQRVNIALASAKALGGNTVTLFSRSMETVVDQQRHLCAEIRDALLRNQFDLEYQPTVSLASGLIHGVEALIRWNHPTRGRLSPDEFVPFAERNGLSIEIGRWVLARALHDIMGLPLLPSKFRCYVNISAPGLEEDAFVSNVRSDFAQYPGAVDHFGIEVTEGAAMLNAERAIISLGALRRLGLQIAIDDFGTGYSSLSYLKRLPIDIIKLDRSFITGLPYEQADVAMADTLLAMASRFRLTTLAEGVESKEQATWLADHGCEYAQGFLYSKSISIAALQELLAANEPLQPSFDAVSEPAA
jgi:diguanylate cyclase (GGDEF)-like protein